MITSFENDFMQIFPVFRKTPDRILDQVLSVGVRKTFVANDRIYTEGDVCAAIAFVLSGEIRVYKIGQTGREITLYEIGPGETCILNASCILSNRSYPAHATALSSGEVLLVPASIFRRLVAENEAIRDFVFSLVSLRLAQVMELVEEIAFGRVDERLMEYLAEKSENGALRITHQKIANDLGTSREVVSRILKDFERKGTVGLSRNEIRLLKYT